MAEPRALVVSPEPPYPIQGGGALRTASIHEYLRQRYNVDLVVFRQQNEPNSPQATATLRLPYHSRSTAAKVGRNLVRFATGKAPLMDRFGGAGPELTRLIGGREYDVAVLEHFWTAPYVDQVAPHARRTILDLHNIESVWLERAADSRSRPMRLPFLRWAKSCRQLERELLPRFALVLVTSEDDARTVRELAPSVDPLVYPNAIPLVPQPLSEKRNAIVFSGNLEYEPNRAAIEYFARRIWPAVAREFGDLEWHLIGRNPDAVRPVVSQSPRVRVVGAIDDAVLELSRYRAAVVPVLFGSGTRFKIIEAWAAGTPVVSTTLGSEGLPVTDGVHLLLADDPQGFVQGLSRILTNSLFGQSLSASGRRLYEERFCWNVVWPTLSNHGI